MAQIEAHKNHRKNPWDAKGPTAGRSGISEAVEREFMTYEWILSMFRSSCVSRFENMLAHIPDTLGVKRTPSLTLRQVAIFPRPL